MLGTDFISYVSNMQVATYVGVEDFADKFNFIVTVMVFLMCTTIVTVKQYILKPISCYIATEVGGKNLLDYVENYCWVQGTIPISYTGNVPENENEWKKLEKDKLLYYQWVPFVLGLQCVLFYLPRVIWKIICYNRTGTDLEHLVSLANEAVRANSKNRSEIVKHLANSLEQLLFQHREYRMNRASKIRRLIFSWCSLLFISKRLGNKLFGTYMVIKWIYLANSVGQMYLMQKFIGLNSTNFTFFGVTIAQNILEGKDWETTLIFPRVGLCIVPIRQLAGIVYTISQCTLPMNMLNERIYMFLWFWLAFNSLITAYSIPIWLFRMTFLKSRYRFVKRYLSYQNQFISDDKVMVHKFSSQFLRHDGVFLLHMLSLNAGDVVGSEITQTLWTIYKDRYYNRDFNDDGEITSKINNGSNYINMINLNQGKLSMCRDFANPSAPCNYDDMEKLNL